MRRARQEVVHPEAEYDYQRQPQRRGPVHPAPPRPVGVRRQLGNRGQVHLPPRGCIRRGHDFAHRGQVHPAPPRPTGLRRQLAHPGQVHPPPRGYTGSRHQPPHRGQVHPPPRGYTASRHYSPHRGQVHPPPRRYTASRHYSPHRGQIRPAPLGGLGRGGHQLLQAHRRGRTRRPVERVILGDQRLSIGPHHLGDGADVPPGVEVATTGGVVAVFDSPDDRFPDPGPLTDLGNTQTGPLARHCQGFTDGHPRLPYPAAPRTAPGGTVRAVPAISMPSGPLRNRHPRPGLGACTSPIDKMLSMPRRR